MRVRRLVVARAVSLGERECRGGVDDENQQEESQQNEPDDGQFRLEDDPAFPSGEENLFVGVLAGE